MLLPPVKSPQLAVEVRSSQQAFEAIAAIAHTDAEMGETDEAVRKNVMALFQLVGLSTREDMLAIAAEIRTSPQLLDVSTDEGAGLRARDIVRDLADHLEA